MNFRTAGQTTRPIFCMGVFRSASTWLANVVCRLDDRALVFADDFETFVAEMQGRDALTVKCHTPDQAIRAAIFTEGYPLIISIRHPLDCVASYMRQLHLSFEHAANAVIASCDIAVELASDCPHMLVRYESSRRDAAQTSEIANYIGGSARSWLASEVAEAHSPAAVRDKIDRLVADGILEANVPWSFDPVTHWHPGHLGSGKSENYGDQLDPSQISFVADALRVYSRHFGYSLDPH